MKKIVAATVILAMLLSFGVIFTSAELPTSIYWCEGKYLCDNPNDFSPVGDIQIEWDPEASNKLNLTDGNMGDWAQAGYQATVITPTNMVTWFTNAAPVAATDWNIYAYFVADEEWLYMGFCIIDSEFVYADASNDLLDGDLLQIGFDFGGLIEQTTKEDPDMLTDSKNIFYSLACAEDDVSIQIKRHESDGIDAWLSEANGHGVQGTAYKTDTGWNAEVALSLNMLSDDCAWKTWSEDALIYIGGENNAPLDFGCFICYVNRSTADSVLWAASTTNGLTNDTGKPVVSWTFYDNGINLYLPYEDGMKFDCSSLVVLPKDVHDDSDQDPGTSLPEDPDLIHEIAELSAQLTELENAVRASNTELIDAIDVIKTRLNELEAQGEIRAAEIQTIKASISSIQSAADAFNNLERNLEQMEIELEQTNTDLGQTKTELEQAKADLEQAKADLEQRKSDLDSVESSLIAAIQEENANLKQDIQALREELDGMKENQSISCQSSVAPIGILAVILIGMGCIYLLRKKQPEE